MMGNGVWESGKVLCRRKRTPLSNVLQWPMANVQWQMESFLPSYDHFDDVDPDETVFIFDDVLWRVTMTKQHFIASRLQVK